MTILCYHSIQPDWDSALAVEPADFGRHAAWLSRSRRVVSLRDAAGTLDRAGRLPAGAAAITFDDGFGALYEHAMPVLRRYRLPASVFLVAQTLTPAGRTVDWVDHPPAEPPSTLTRDEILDMQADGVDFQSHSFAHHDLTRLTYDECVRDLRDSRALLSDLLGRHVDLLAYPRGRHDEHVRAAAEKAGYRYAFALPETTERPERYAVPRVGIYRGNGLMTVRLKSSARYLGLRTDRRVSMVRRTLRPV